MNPSNKRMNNMDSDQFSKRVRKECNYGESCYRLNPAHFREFSHPHLEAILDTYGGTGDYNIPEKYSLQKNMIVDQLNVIVEKKFYEPKRKCTNDSSVANTSQNNQESSKNIQIRNSVSKTNDTIINSSQSQGTSRVSHVENQSFVTQSTDNLKTNEMSLSKNINTNETTSKRQKSKSPTPGLEVRIRDSDYRPIVPPTKRPEEFLKVVLPRGRMALKHEQSAPYHIFYTTINDSKPTHSQPFSITFLELLDQSLGELKCSLQINFMVDVSWLLAHYYFAGYSAKKLTILYGDDCGQDLKNISKKKPNVEAQYVNMATPFGTHHTKMMLLCYEDGSMRVVVSTANLYTDDWENRTQGSPVNGFKACQLSIDYQCQCHVQWRKHERNCLWLSPRCPELPPDSMPHDGESPTMFKKSLIRYLGHYHLPQLVFYLDRVKRCDFSQINVFLVSSVPGSHFDMDFGMTRVGSLLRQHALGAWPLYAQASSIGSYGAKPSLWLTGDFLHHFTKTKDQPQTLTQPAPLKIIYPSLENVKQSHDGILGGGCLPYGANVNNKQLWLKEFLYQWRSTSIHRNKAMPHIKSYTRVSPDNKMASYFLLTSANISKAAWGSINKGNRALRIMSYEAGVLFLPKFVINQDYFPLEENVKNRLILPYDVPPVKYTSDMSPWVSDYLN